MFVLQPKKPKLLVYCDESCTGERYLALGATMHLRDHGPGIMEKLQPHLSQFKSEIKWQKVTNPAEAKYRALVDCFFEVNRSKTLHYHCLFADCHKFKHSAFMATDEDTFYKLYYNLLTHRVSRYGEDFDIHVYMDERVTHYSLTQLRTILNRGAQKTFGLPRWPYRTVEPIDSKRSKIMQTQDVILGGMATRKNGLHLLNTREAKKNLSQHIFNQTGVATYDRDTSSRKIFSIWNFALR